MSTHLDPTSTKETLNSWFTKGGASAVATAMFFFGSQFVDTQDEILHTVQALKESVIIAKTDRVQLDARLKEVEQYIEQQWTRARRADATMEHLVNAWNRVNPTEKVHIRQLDEF